jgi:hypothetical protein
MREYESAIQIVAGGNNAYLSAANAEEAGAGYVVTATAPTTGDTFTITRKAAGEVVRTCKAETSNKDGCPSGSW